MSDTHNDARTSQCIHAMLEEQIYGVVSTLRQHHPFQHIIAHAFSEDLRYIYFANDSSNALGINIAQQPLINVIWDNRTGDVEDVSLNAYVTASGFASKLGDIKARMIKPILLARHPDIEADLDQPLVKIYSIQVHTYHYHHTEKDTAFFYPNKATASANNKQATLT